MRKERIDEDREMKNKPYAKREEWIRKKPKERKEEEKTKTTGDKSCFPCLHKRFFLFTFVFFPFFLPGSLKAKHNFCACLAVPLCNVTLFLRLCWTILVIQNNTTKKNEEQSFFGKSLSKTQTGSYIEKQTGKPLPVSLGMKNRSLILLKHLFLVLVRQKPLRNDNSRNF